MVDRKIGYCLLSNPGHLLQGHPESPHRFSLLSQLPGLPIAESLESIQSQSIDESLLTEVHSSHYLQQVKSAVERAPTRLDAGDTYVTGDSWQAALSSAGAAVAAAGYSFENEQTSFSISRPPGHHATTNTALGFCLLNNIALAARFLQSQGVSRLLIVDFDVHHGNGTQEIFEYDGSVYYLSTHQRGIFPGTGHLDESGIGEGEGTIQNVPLPAFTGDDGYLAIFLPLLKQVAASFQPEAILVSAGYDAHWQDPLANLHLSCSTYYSIASILYDIAQEYSHGRLTYILEGGYNPTALYHSIEHTFHGLLSLPPPADPLGKSPHDEADISQLMEQLLHL